MAASTFLPLSALVLPPSEPVPARKWSKPDMASARDCGRIDPFILSDLLGKLYQLQQNNGYLDDDIFCSRSLTSCSLLLSDVTSARGQLHTFLAALESLKALGDALQTISAFVQQTIVKVQIHCRPLANFVGINAFPNELLSRIFEEGYSYKDVALEVDNFSNNISHVCRRFRDVALKTPKIWSTLANAHSQDQLSTYIQRSKAVKLYISINETRDASRYESMSLPAFLRAVVPHAARWWRFSHFQLPNRVQEDTAALLQYPSLFLPSLESLTLCRKPEGKEIQLMEFCSSWTMPVLAEFYGSAIVPNSEWAHTLTSYNLLLDEISPSPAPLLMALAKCFRLEKIQILSFQSIRPFSHDNIPPVSVNFLTSLSIQIVLITTPHLLDLFMMSLVAPNLQKLSIEVGIRHASLSDWETKTTDTQLHSKARVAPEIFSLVVKSNDSFLCDHVLSFFLARLPGQRLKHLVVEAPTLRFISEVQALIPSALQTLQFLQCDNLELDEVWNYIDAISADPEQWVNFKRLEIIECPKAADEALYIGLLQDRLGDKFVYQYIDTCA